MSAPDAERCTDCGTADFTDGRRGSSTRTRPLPTTLVGADENNGPRDTLCPACNRRHSQKTGQNDGIPIDGGWGGYTPDPMADALWDAAREIAYLQRRLAVARPSLKEDETP